MLKKNPEISLFSYFTVLYGSANDPDKKIRNGTIGGIGWIGELNTDIFI